MGPQEEQGTAAGAIIRRHAWRRARRRDRRAAGGGHRRLAGAAIGGLIGNRIGAALDEEDREAMVETTRAAIRSGKTTALQEQAHRRARPRRWSVRQQGRGPACRTIKQEVVLKDGKMVSDTVRACRGPNGWEV